MEKKLTLIEKLAKIREIADVAAKEKQGYNYNYVDVTSILAKVTGGMKTQGVSLIPSFVPESADVSKVVSVNTKTSKRGGEVYDQTSTEMKVQMYLNYRWINNEDPNDYMDILWFTVGSQSDPSQALGTALTYSMRQFLCNFFQIAQVDYDVDKYRKEQKEAEDKEEKAILTALIEQIDKSITSYLKEHPDEGAQVKKFVSKYVKDSNYKKIKDSKTAGELLKAFTGEFIISKEEKVEESKTEKPKAEKEKEKK